MEVDFNSAMKLSSIFLFCLFKENLVTMAILKQGRDDEVLRMYD